MENPTVRGEHIVRMLDERALNACDAGLCGRQGM